MSSFECPCPCPIEKELQTSTSWGFNVEKLNKYHTPGDTVNSPGGSFEYKIESYPFSRLYYDLRGDFEKYSWNKLNKEEDITDEILKFLGAYKNGGFVYPPSYTRLLNTMIIVYILLLNVNSAALYSVFLEMTHKPMCHKDNNPWQQTDNGTWIKGEYPCTYYVKLPGLTNKPHERTIRWKT